MDVIKTLKLSKENFIAKYPKVIITKISQTDFANSMMVQLEARINRNINKKDGNTGDEVEIIYRDEQINKILDVETTVITI